VINVTLYTLFCDSARRYDYGRKTGDDEYDDGDYGGAYGFSGYGYGGGFAAAADDDDDEDDEDYVFPGDHGHG